MATKPINLTVLISGSGTNLQALIDATSGATPALPDVKITQVISNRKNAYGLTRAHDAGIPTAYHNLVEYKKRHPATDPSSASSTEEAVKKARADYDTDLVKLILSPPAAVPRPDLIVLAGFMHILSPEFLNPLAEHNVPVINLHPSLPGTYLGANALERAHKDWSQGKIDKTGLMIHKVIVEVDEGEPLLVVEVPFEKGKDDDLAKFEERFHTIEWQAIVQGTGKAVDKIREERG